MKKGVQAGVKTSLQDKDKYRPECINYAKFYLE